MSSSPPPSTPPASNEPAAPPPDGDAPLTSAGAALLFVRSSPWEALGVAGLLVSLASLVAAQRWSVTIHGWDELGRNWWHHLWGLALLLLLTLRVRTVGLRQAAAMWATGFFTVIGLVVVTTEPVQGWLGDTAFVVGYWVPLLEEGFKAVPLVVFALLAGRHRDQQLAVSDLVVLGFCVGAGFAIHEDALYGIARGAGVGGGGLHLVLPMSPLFPFVAGHAVWGALIGLGVGVATRLRRVPLAAMAVVAAATLAAALDHGRANLNALDEAPLLIELVAGATGRRVAWLVLAGTAVAIAADWWTARRAGGQLRHWPPVGPASLLAAARSSEGPLDAVVRTQGCLRYHRLRNRVSHALGTPGSGVSAVPRRTAARLAVWGLLGGVTHRRS